MSNKMIANIESFFTTLSQVVDELKSTIVSQAKNYEKEINEKNAIIADLQRQIVLLTPKKEEVVQQQPTMSIVAEPVKQNKISDRRSMFENIANTNINKQNQWKAIGKPLTGETKPEPVVKEELPTEGLLHLPKATKKKGKKQPIIEEQVVVEEEIIEEAPQEVAEEVIAQEEVVIVKKKKGKKQPIVEEPVEEPPIVEEEVVVYQEEEPQPEIVIVKKKKNKKTKVVDEQVEE